MIRDRLRIAGALAQSITRGRLLLACALFVICSVPFYTTGVATNCGGNSAALAQVSQIAVIARVGSMDAPDHLFYFSKANSRELDQLSELGQTFWLHGAHFLVSTSPVSENEPQPRRVIVVCDTAYRNVPQRRFGSAPPTHAAGFADGSCGLISTTEFAKLDPASLVPLDKVYPPTQPRASTPD